jgi:hypothetical protein
VVDGAQASAEGFFDGVQAVQNIHASSLRKMLDCRDADIPRTTSL